MVPDAFYSHIAIGGDTTKVECWKKPSAGIQKWFLKMNSGGGYEVTYIEGDVSFS